MFVTFKELPPHARVWVYQADRQLSDEEVATAESESRSFLEGWAAHGQGLLSSSNVFHNRFLVIAVDEEAAAASGCSIDSSVHFVQRLGQKFGIDFFNRQIVCWIENEIIRDASLQDIKQLVSEGELKPTTQVFDNLVPNISSFNTGWIKPANETWLARYFRKEEASV